MRRWLIMLILAFVAASPAGAAQRLSVTVDKQPLALGGAPLLLEGRTFLTPGDMAAAVRGTVQDEKERITLHSGSRTVAFLLGKNRAVVDGREQQLERGAVAMGGRWYLPLRWTAEQFGFRVAWDAESRTVSLEREVPDGRFVETPANALSANEQAFVDQVRAKQGIHRLGNLYVIARGPVPNPGYGLKVAKQQMSWEQLLVYVELTAPEPGKLYPQVISYPYLLGRTELPPGVSVVFLDASTGKPLFHE